MKKINIGLIFGGKSGEHEVSIFSAQSIFSALDRKKYTVKLIGIDKNGLWHLQEGDSKPQEIKNNQERVVAIAEGNRNYLIARKGGKNLAQIDVFFPIIHGTNGEDGTLQGLLELLDAAYVGAGVLGSAVGMDKEVMKRLLREAGIPVADWTIWKSNKDNKKIEEFAKKKGFPLFVKPANMGSSVGISKAHNKKELKKSIEDASLYDSKVIVEEFISGREIECSVLGNDEPLASVPGEVKPTHEFYDYEAKYIDEKGANLEIPAKLNGKEIKQIREIAVKTFQALECFGMGRVDMFLRPDGKILVNEINTLPGFTKNSMYPKLWEASGMPFPKLLDKLISLAVERKGRKDKLRHSYK